MDRSDTGEVNIFPLILLVILLFLCGQEMLGLKMQDYPLLAIDYCLFFERFCRRWSMYVDDCGRILIRF